MDKIRHGETQGWVAGCRENCCRQAIYAYNRQRNSEVAIHGEAGKRRVNAVGTRRRVQALSMMGWTGQEIAEAIGYDTAAAARMLMTRSTVRRDTAERVAAAYEKLWARYLAGELRGLTDGGVRRRSIEAGRRKGWVPGAAWDDIDDPTEKPQGLSSVS